MSTWQVKKDNKSYFKTEYDECMYPLDVMLTIIKAGFKIYKDGKVYTPTKTAEKKESTKVKK